MVVVAGAALCALASIGSASPSAARGNPETCIYRDARLAEACRTDPDIRAFLREPSSAAVESYMAIPPVLRGWEPGEEDMVLSMIRGQQQPPPPPVASTPVHSTSATGVMARIDRLANGEFNRQMEAERARTPRVNWSPAQIRAAARMAVTDKLRDPSSAQFRNVRRSMNSRGTTTYCGEVNSRNVYGGMTGFRRFHSGVTDRGEASARINDEGGVMGTLFEATWEQICEGVASAPAQL